MANITNSTFGPETVIVNVDILIARQIIGYTCLFTCAIILAQVCFA